MIKADFLPKARPARLHFLFYAVIKMLLALLVNPEQIINNSVVPDFMGQVDMKIKKVAFFIYPEFVADANRLACGVHLFAKGNSLGMGLSQG